HLTRGELDEAREGILVGLANARHLSKTPFYIIQLMSLSIQDVMFDRVGEMISQPNSPNLYWSLTTLPGVLPDFERSARLQRDMFTRTLPAAAELDRPRDPREWRRMAAQLVELLRSFREIPPAEPADPTVIGRLARFIVEESPLRRYLPLARRELPAMFGLTEAAVAAMTEDEACVRWFVRRRIELEQGTTALFSLPPREARPQLNRWIDVGRSLYEVNDQHWKFSRPDALYYRPWSFQRRVQMLRIVEAVRDHLATHDGKLPASLDEIAVVPIPIDVLTDKPFRWSIEDGVGVLASPPSDPAGAADGLVEPAGIILRLKVQR
ncbi:MAG: hypothetical protein ACRDD1_02220, partial [Planctomycetia bacterium]